MPSERHFAAPLSVIITAITPRHTLKATFTLFAILRLDGITATYYRRYDETALIATLLPLRQIHRHDIFFVTPVITTLELPYYAIRRYRHYLR